jgi:GcrA cell cycle regulator
MNWPKEKIEDLMTEFDAGGTADDIAKALSVKFCEDVTRNAVLGKLHRIRLETKRAKSIVKRTRKTVKKTRVPPTAVRWDTLPPEKFRCSIYQLNDERCRWPLGAGPPFEYCGASVTKGGYCHYHHQLSLRKDQPHARYT